MFIEGFEKSASKGSALAKVWKETQLGAKAFKSGLESSAKATVGNTMKLTKLRGTGQAMKSHGGVIKGLQSEKGRRALAEHLGKAAPEIAVGGAYAVGAKKVYDAATKGQDSSYNVNMSNAYY